jgi:hypothetical protein
MRVMVDGEGLIELRGSTCLEGSGKRAAVFPLDINLDEVEGEA